MAHLLKTIALSASASLALGAAHAETVDPSSPASIVAALQEIGLRAQLGSYENGRPRISSSIEGIEFSIGLHNCMDDYTDCGSLLFIKAYDLADGLDYSVINDWNSSKLVGRAFLDDERDPFLDYFVDAEFGIQKETLEDAIEGWGRALIAFEDTIGWSR